MQTSVLAVSVGLTLLFADTASAQTPVAEWQFDQGSGTRAVSSTGAEGDATLRGRTGWSAGLTGAHALQLPGQPGAFAEAAAPAIDTSGSYTISAAVKMDRASGWQTFVSRDGKAVSGFFLQLRGDTGEFAFTTLTRDAPDGDTDTAGSRVDPIEGIWYHLVGVHDAAAHTLSLYINGALAQTVPTRAAWKSDGATIIGRGKYDSRPVDFANGAVDSVRLFDKALPASEVRSLFLRDVPLAQRIDPNAPTPTAQITIDAARPGPAVSLSQHGLMTEEINHAYDGGLYAELIQNRAFLDSKEPVHWSLVQDGGTGTMALDSAEPVSKALPVSLKLTATSITGGANPRVGAANAGYWGISVRPNTSYRASFWARAAAGTTGALTVSIESSDGKTALAKTDVKNVTSGWKQYTVTLKTGATAASLTNRLVVSLHRPGTVWLNLVSLFPPTYKNRPNGNRPDLMGKMADLKPRFLRFPGGNFLEGDTIADRFDWKRTLGPLTDRPGHQTPWGYRSTNGLGLMEFLDWCDDLSLEPVLAVYAGYSLNHYRNPNGERVEPGPALQPFVQDALDEIEFLTGDTKTTWGAKRAALGHPKPYTLRYVEIGNEDWFDASGSYEGRFAQFFDAIKAKYPKLQIIATTNVRSRKPDVMDEHYYLPARSFLRDSHHYDNYDRKGPKIFVGEWASQDGNPTATLYAALGDIAWLIGMERNSDIVIMETYAPLLVNVNPGAWQWDHPNLIGYNALTSFGSPSHYAQVLFAENKGTVSLPMTITDGPRLVCGVTRDEKTKTIYVKIVNPTAKPQPAAFDLQSVDAVLPTGEAIVLASDNRDAANSIENPANIVPRTVKLSGLGKKFQHVLPPYSFTVLRISTK
ncbi:MAG: alpha-L-arabinofuranosidase C-terminal domain-containing protein [Armatimonadota bacterium]